MLINYLKIHKQMIFNYNLILIIIITYKQLPKLYYRSYIIKIIVILSYKKENLVMNIIKTNHKLII